MSARKWTPEKLRELYARRIAGESVSAIADACGVSRERVRQLIDKAKRFERRDWMLANGWTVVDGRWVDPPGPPESWPEYPGDAA
jgi:hypothetical protein